MGRLVRGLREAEECVCVRAGVFVAAGGGVGVCVGGCIVGSISQVSHLQDFENSCKFPSK